METGRVIHRRYFLQRLIKQGVYCTVYQGTDQLLQRAVAVKVVPAEHIPAYRAALRATAQFAHPNIVGTYDLIIEPDKLYIVQEYIDGEDFSALLQVQQTPYQVAELGIQLCQALLYASSTTRRLCHGDLTPQALIRDRLGLVRVNSFALPSNVEYFGQWSFVGGEGLPLADRELPWGQLSDGRQEDDTRAVGILLYQLLAGRNPGATSVEPPADGRLRFLRNIPPELCDVIARTLIREHPNGIHTIEALHGELKPLAESYEAQSFTPPASYPMEDGTKLRSAPLPGTGKLVTALPMREAAQTGTNLAAFRATPEAPKQTSSMDMAPASPTVANIPMKLVTSRQAAYAQQSQQLPQQGQQSTSGWSVPLLVGISIVVFIIFLAIGYFVALNVLH